MFCHAIGFAHVLVFGFAKHKLKPNGFDFAKTKVKVKIFNKTKDFAKTKVFQGAKVMAATASITRKNAFNKTRAVKCAIFTRLLDQVVTQRYPNGNSGYQQGVVYALTQQFPATVVLRCGGDPHSMGHVTFDPSRLTAEEAKRVEGWLLPADGQPVDANNPVRGWGRTPYPADHKHAGLFHSERFMDRDTIFKVMQRECGGYFSRLDLSK